MKKIIRDTLILTAITLISGLALADGVPDYEAAHCTGGGCR